MHRCQNCQRCFSCCSHGCGCSLTQIRFFSKKCISDSLNLNRKSTNRQKMYKNIGLRSGCSRLADQFKYKTCILRIFLEFFPISCTICKPKGIADQTLGRPRPNRLYIFLKKSPFRLSSTPFSTFRFRRIHARCMPLTNIPTVCFIFIHVHHTKRRLLS